MADDENEAIVFNEDEVNLIIKEVVESTLGTSAYEHKKVATWQSMVVENCLKRLYSLGRNYKYVVTCMITQNTGAGVHTSHTCYWDANTDGKKVPSTC